MRNKVLIITSRFSSVSNFFDLWLESASRNPEFDFMILTDIDIPYKSDNIILKKYTDLVSFINDVDERLGYKTGISSPFKTADLRPAYAYMFRDIIQEVYRSRHDDKGNYDFWGYIDTDLILGNLRHFINDAVLDNCDVFQTWGHFTLVRNICEINSLYCKPYKKYSFKRSLKLPENCMLEEGPFLLQLSSAGARIDSKVSRIADIKRWKFNFTIDGINYRNQCFVYLNGEVRRFAQDNEGNAVNEEFMYIHFMKRVINIIPERCYDLLLTENGFYCYDKEKIHEQTSSEEAFENWKLFTCATADSRFQQVSLGYKLLHLDNWMYRKATRDIEMDKRGLIKVYYEL